MSRLVVVSNRVPPPGDKAAEAGGLAVALKAALRERGGLWLGWSGQTVDDENESDSYKVHTREDGNITFALVDLGQGNLFLLLLISAAVCLILGMGMPTVGVYLLLAVLVAPSLVETGVEPIAAHLFIFYLGMMSMVTPPIGIGAFFAASIAKAPPMPTALEAMRFGWTAYIVPFLFVFSPALLLIGDPLQIALAVISAVLGVYAISAAFVGWFAGPAGSSRRVLVGMSGIALLLPPGIGGEATLWINAAGLVLLVGQWLTAARLSGVAQQPHTQEMES